MCQRSNVFIDGKNFFSVSPLHFFVYGSVGMLNSINTRLSESALQPVQIRIRFLIRDLVQIVFRPVLPWLILSPRCGQLTCSSWADEGGHVLSCWDLWPVTSPSHRADFIGLFFFLPPETEAVNIDSPPSSSDLPDAAVIISPTVAFNCVFFRCKQSLFLSVVAFPPDSSKNVGSLVSGWC